MISEIIIKSFLQEAIKSTLKFLKEKKLRFDSTEKEIEEAINTHVSEIDTWSKEINFNDLKKAKLTANVFIDVDISLMPRKYLLSNEEQIDKISSNGIFNKIDNHLVILGQPGAGKTTLTKYWCQSILWDEKFFPNIYKIPIVIRLRDINEKPARFSEKNVIINILFELLGLVITKEKNDTKIEDDDINLAKERLLYPILENLNPLIILDGFDELASEKIKLSVLSDFKRFALNLKSGKIILTSRTSDYAYTIDNTTVLEICPLNRSQIKKFATRWLVDANRVTDFLKSLDESPFCDTAIRPLTISHLCAIYERIGKIPDKPKTVYKKIINLLLEEWDEQRAIKRVSAYAGFEIDRKFDFISRVAYEITQYYKTTSISENNLRQIVNSIKTDFNLENEDAYLILREIESHTGLIIESAYKYFEFSHKSIHEYLCAEHLVKLPIIPNEVSLLSRIPNELAIATTISSNPSLYFIELIFNRLYNKNKYLTKSAFKNNFITTFVNRLVLEKPDFNSSLQTSFALVLLYTLFRTTDTNQLKIFESDLPAQFEKFLNLIFKHNNKFKYSEYYTIEEEFQSETDELLVRLAIKNNIEPYILEKHSLPKYLYSKYSFLEDIKI